MYCPSLFGGGRNANQGNYDNQIPDYQQGYYPSNIGEYIDTRGGLSIP